MNDMRTSFLTYYIQILGERTREEKRGTKFGFDWVIYNIALSEDWIPHRLPFIRTGGSDTSTTKTEPEFGVDLAFLSPDLKILRIFVLKDEVLNNANWGSHNFDIDLRSAAAPDLKASATADVEQVEVILAYNKDEDRTGVELYDRLIATLGTRVGDNVGLRFDRWNLTTIVGKVQSGLLTPSLLPQKYFSHFSYLCAQFADFRHGSDEWANQMVPNWRRFLSDLLAENADERCVRLLPVALLILQEFGKDNPTVETAWIDLAEWGMLAAWNVSRLSTKKPIIKAVLQIWIEFYLVHLERYYDAHSEHLAIHLSVDKTSSGSFVDTIASAVVAHWHLARIGILGVSYAECLPNKSADDKNKRQHALSTVSNWLAAFLDANPSAMRPLIDLHHIELFLTWATFLQVGRQIDLRNWFLMLINRLTMRRFGNAQIPFIEGGNAIDLIFEYVATGEKPHEFCDASSVYLLCLMELLCSLPTDQRDPLLSAVYHRLVLGKADCGTQMNECAAIDLMSWIPSADWGNLVLNQKLSDEGECATIHLTQNGGAEPTTSDEIVRSINDLISETRAKRDFKWPENVPLTVVVLACLKHRSPLPPEIWRHSIFRTTVVEEKTETEMAKPQ